MHAAVVTDFAAPPRYLTVAEPGPAGPGEEVVEVVAAALHPRVRSQADGSHYTSTGRLPLIPGIDAVVRDDAGRLRYTVLDDTESGTMAERTVIETRRSVLLPDDVDPIAVAAVMNPAMSSWVALRRRIDFVPGQRVLVLGATGSAGRTAIEVARRFGAGAVIAAGRNPDRLTEWSTCSRPDRTVDDRSPGFRSDRSPVPPRRSPRPHCGPAGWPSWVAGSARFRGPTTSPNSRRSRRRPAPAPSTYVLAPSR
jgi:NADPH:quinone reductase-like Zn-dependent oxidoreductase